LSVLHPAVPSARPASSRPAAPTTFGLRPLADRQRLGCGLALPRGGSATAIPAPRS